MTTSRTQNDSSFHTLVSRRWNTPEKKCRLLNQIEAHKGCDLSPLLDARVWNAAALLHIHPLTALKAVLHGRITAIQMATLYQFKNGVAASNGRLEIVPLFEGGKPSLLARALIVATLFINEKDRHLNDDEIDSLFEEMRLKPLSEQRFFVIPNRAPPEERGEHINALSEIVDALGFNVFSNLPNKKWMIPSFGMMEAFGTVFGKNGVIKIAPVIDFSTRRQIVNGMRTRVREFAFVLTHKTIDFDELSGPSVEGPAHDFYHYYNHLLLPPLFLEAFGEIASHLLDEAECAEITARSWIYKLIDAIADQENFEFRNDDRHTLAYLPRSSLFFFLLKRLIDETAEGYPETFIAPILRSLHHYLREHREEWNRLLRIDVTAFP